jgi:mRNA-degrading endonuclease RelE of RelBE toxin-antitoxin system
VTVIESEVYRELPEKSLTEQEREGVRNFLAEYPGVGDIIPGLDGLRKLHWTHQQRNKGKRGGTRVIYFCATSDGMVVLLDMCSKEKKEDLTNADRKEFKAALAASRNKRTRKKFSAWAAACPRPRLR